MPKNDTLINKISVLSKNQGRLMSYALSSLDAEFKVMKS
jgi:hypothetical protein